MTSGELYLPNDESIMEEQLKCLDRLYDFNLTRPTELDKRGEMLKEMFAEIGDDCYIEPPLHAVRTISNQPLKQATVGDPSMIICFSKRALMLPTVRKE